MATRLINGMAVEIDGDGDGDGAPMLCIHGLGGSSNTWTPLLAALDGFTIIRPDLPGSARSALPTADLSIDVFVAAIDRLLDELEIEAAHVVAHSMGTIVAQHLAITRPNRVRSLALYGPLVAPAEAAKPAIAGRAELARTGIAGIQQIADAIVQGATAKQTKSEQPAVVTLVRESVMRQTPEGYAQSCEALATAQAAAIEGIRIPTLLLTGDQDAVAPPDKVAAMHQLIAGSEFSVIEACGHWPTFEQPQASASKLQSFLASLR